MRHQRQHPIIDIYVSHSAPLAQGGIKWFVVAGSPVEDHVQSLLESGRTVYQFRVMPRLGPHDGTLIKLRPFPKRHSKAEA